MKRFPAAVLLTLILTVVASAPVCAAVGKQDFQVLMRAIGFLQSPPAGDVDFAVVYDPSNQGSAEEGRQIQDALDGGYTIGSMILHPKLVPVSNIDAISHASFVFVAAGTDAYRATVAKIAKAHKILSLSLDKSCVEDGHCVLYVNTANRVEIIVNKAAAEQSGVMFKPTFMVLVTTL